MAETIENGAKLAFESNFWQLAQQERSLLESSLAVKYIDPNAKTHNLPRMGGLELVEVAGRNPRKNYSDFLLDNRMFTKRRFALSILLDEKDDVNELIADPTSALMQNLLKAKARVVDRIIVEAAAGDVLTGRPDRAPTKLSATDDGVLTIDATSGLTADKVNQVMENFINHNIDMADIQRTVLLITGKENTALMSEEKFINNDYIQARPIETGIQTRAGGFDIVMFAGSSTGGVGTLTNPILEEKDTKRTCLALAPQSVALMMQLGRFDVKEAPEYVNSKSLNIDLWINAMRTEGARVQKIETTI